MATFKTLYMGGTEGHPETGDIYNSGICYRLANPSWKSERFSFPSEGWDVEVNKGDSLIVASSKDKVPVTEIFHSGYEYCQRFLDILAVDRHDINLIRNPGLDYTIVFDDAGSTVLRKVSWIEIPFRTESSYQLIRDGKIVESPKRNNPDWHRAYRYYRLSQSNDNIYDAYRYLFLSFEAVLAEIYPQDLRREKDWLDAAIREVMKRVDLSKFVPSGCSMTPGDYLKEKHYTSLRNKLFHARLSGSILPHDDPNPVQIIEDYRVLTRIWDAIVKEYREIFGVSRLQGGITHAGFRDIVENVFAHQEIAMVFLTESPSVLKDRSRQNRGAAISSTEIEPGMHIIKSEISSRDLPDRSLIKSICLARKETILVRNRIEEGIHPIGTDRVEGHLTFRYRNSNSSRMVFN